MEDKKVMCNWTPHCENEHCPHKLPHLLMYSNNHPECEQEDTYGYWQDRPVNCVEVSYGGKIWVKKFSELTEN